MHNLPILDGRELSLATICLVLLFGCGGGGDSTGSTSGGGQGGGTTPPPTALPPTVQSSTITLPILGVASSALSASISASDPAGRPLTYSVSQAPTSGSVTVNPQTGAYTYTVPGYVTSAADQFVVTVSNGGTSGAATVRINFASDPLLQSQWHIKNTGADAFASVLPSAGNDLNMAPVWAAGFSGKGVKVAVVDTGLEAAHEDLSANVEVGKSFNFITGLNDPSRLQSDPGFDHGTSVAGVIGAVAYNGKGGRGVAYAATLRGYNLLASFSIANYAKSMGSDPISADNDIFNGSFTTPQTTSFSSLPTFTQAYQEVAGNLQDLRNGLGAVWVSSAGNDFGAIRGFPDSYCKAAQSYGVSCGNVAADTRRGGRTPIIVGALNADGVKASYSTAGSGLWVSAPGGEFGISSTYVPNVTNSVAYKPAIVAPSRTGCGNYSQAVNPLDSRGASPFALQCQYTAIMNGTSSATPNVSGVVALMLEANPRLTWRDVRYILAKTAKKVDPTFPGRVATDVVPNQSVVLEQGWVTNAAGWSFSNWYGFGAVDAAAAVALARAYSSYLPPIKEANAYQLIPTAPYTVPPLSTAGYPIRFQVAEPFNVVEYVTVFVNVALTPIAGCNQIELTSPSGTKSILLNAANGFQNISLPNVRFLSNAFFGEAINGTWTLRFLDYCGSTTPTVLSSTQPQVLLLSGH